MSGVSDKYQERGKEYRKWNEGKGIPQLPQNSVKFQRASLSHRKGIKVHDSNDIIAIFYFGKIHSFCAFPFLFLFVGALWSVEKPCHYTSVRILEPRLIPSFISRSIIFDFSNSNHECIQECDLWAYDPATELCSQADVLLALSQCTVSPHPIRLSTESDYLSTSVVKFICSSQRTNHNFFQILFILNSSS